MRAGHRELRSLSLAVRVAWLVAHTDLPGRGWIALAFRAAFFLPGITVTLSRVLLLDPDGGLVNTGLATRWWPGAPSTSTRASPPRPPARAARRQPRLRISR
ncbi:MAG TPA: hypothetical protein VMT79_14610 [Candidatus Binatia bacterium]|nr:hypothetical protein [Candidatus Binatia bacterium]